MDDILKRLKQLHDDFGKAIETGDSQQIIEGFLKCDEHMRKYILPVDRPIIIKNQGNGGEKPKSEPFAPRPHHDTEA